MGADETRPDGWSASLRRADTDELRLWLAFCASVCDEADAIALAAFRRGVEVTTKPDRTLVTEADRGIEERVRARIAASFPGHGIVGEEYGTEAGGAATRWYVDPIDATANFVRGVPVFATLIAVERDGEMQAGMVSAPALGRRWFASRGEGAWTQERGSTRRLRVSAVATIEESQIVYSSPRALEDDGRAPGFATLVRRSWRDRGFGDFWGYALVADGSAEAMVEVGPSAWDLAAPLIILEEAGGQGSDLEGRRRIDTGSFVGSNRLLHAAILDGLTSVVD
jgi:histidinol-phosphatase